MAVEADRLVVDPKYPRCFGSKRAVRDKRVDAHSGLKMGVNCDKRLRPKATSRVEMIDLPINVRSTDASEGTSKTLVVAN